MEQAPESVGKLPANGINTLPPTQETGWTPGRVASAIFWYACHVSVWSLGMVGTWKVADGTLSAAALLFSVPAMLIPARAALSKANGHGGAGQ